MGFGQALLYQVAAGPGQQRTSLEDHTQRLQQHGHSSVLFWLKRGALGDPLAEGVAVTPHLLNHWQLICHRMLQVWCRVVTATTTCASWPAAVCCSVVCLELLSSPLSPLDPVQGQC